jgi:hypothetical protein
MGAALVDLANLPMTVPSTINYQAGNGIAVTATVNPDLDRYDVEIANILYGLLLSKGDLLVALDEALAGRLPAGTDGQVLTSDSTQATGLRWATGTGTGGDPLTDTKVWLPLFDTDGAVVLDSDEGVVPTLVPIA